MARKKNYGAIMGATIDRIAVRLSKFDAPRELNRHLAAANAAVLNLEQLAATKNPMETDAAHARRVEAAAKSVKAKIERLKADFEGETLRQRERLKREIETKSNLTPSKHAAEIRAALRQMTHKDRLVAMREALTNGDAETLAAIAEGNRVTTGIEDDLRARFVGEFQKQVAPELFDELAGLEEVISVAPKVIEWGQEAAAEAVSPTYIAEISSAQKAAEAAQAAFAESVQ